MLQDWDVMWLLLNNAYPLSVHTYVQHVPVLAAAPAKMVTTAPRSSPGKNWCKRALPKLQVYQLI